VTAFGFGKKRRQIGALQMPRELEAEPPKDRKKARTESQRLFAHQAASRDLRHSGFTNLDSRFTISRIMAEQFDRTAVVALLNQILETELAGVVRYTHYSLMVFGHSRIPIVSWLRGEASTCLDHANAAGELVTHLGEHPSLKIGALLETTKHGINDILIESLEAEKQGLALYKQLLDLVRDRSVFLEEYARKMIAAEEMHLGEVNKMLRKPGEIERFKE
jgi:bacterioferritin